MFSNPCANCSEITTDNYDYKYCPFCGHKISDRKLDAMRACKLEFLKKEVANNKSDSVMPLAIMFATTVLLVIIYFVPTDDKNWSLKQISNFVPISIAFILGWLACINISRKARQKAKSLKQELQNLES